MSTLITQGHRAVAVTTSVGEDVLLLKSMSGTEMLSGCFRFELELVSEQPGKVKFDDIVGQSITISLDLDGDNARFFNGRVSSFEQVASLDNLFQYRAIVVPWFWFLTRASDCRIFQNMTVPDIIKQVFRDHGYSDFDDSLTGQYRTWEYCVQYRETDFNFVSRLMEEEGIYYFFKHDDKAHKLVLADSASAHGPYDGYERIQFHPDGDSPVNSQCIRDLTIGQEVQPGIFALNSFDFQNPKKALSVKTQISREHAAADFEYYDYPGTYQGYSDGETYSKIRADEMHAKFEVVRGKTDARGLCPGYSFKLTQCHPESLNREYLVTSCSYRIHSNLKGLDTQSDSEAESFIADFTAIDTAQQFRPPRITRKPTIQGPQTAMVVGKSGEEIWTDKFGRVKVQFHWDRDGKADENSSCWIRVAQVWAGKKWGAMYIPRIGQEVIVEFLEGDPDQPIITGRVYNADKMPPYELPDNKTRSTIKSDSTKGGGGSNEIRFEDNKDAEELYIHAQKDQLIEVGNDENITIGNDRSLNVGNDETQSVEKNRTISIGENHTESVAGDMTLSVDKNRTMTITKDLTESVDGQMMVTVAKDRSLSVQGGVTENVSKDVMVSVEGQKTQQVAKQYALQAKKIIMQADDEVVIQVGSATFQLKSNGDIKVDGKKITAKGSGDIVLKGSKIKAN